MLHRFRPAAAAFALSLSLAGVLVLPGAAVAAPAPPGVISGVHADVLAMSVVDGSLRMGATATVDGEVDRPVDLANSTFNVESASRITLGRGSNLPFLGDIGNHFWIAPQANPEGTLLWPGANTENIEPGAVDGDVVTVSLASVDGPGFLSIYQTDSIGQHTRILDSRENSGYDSWRLPVGQHQHANWAFSASGAYTLTFAAEVSIAGTTRSVTQAYRFFVGNMVPARSTTTSAPLVSASSTRVGDEVTMTSTVTPADAPGSVEFSTGTESLGYANVLDGVASLTTDRLPIGRQTIAAEFTPASEDDYIESVSSPTVVTVSPARADGSFGIAPIQAAFTDGETATLIATGAPLAAAENYQWVMRQAGSDDSWQPMYDDTTFFAETASTLTRVITTDYDDYEIALQIQRDHLLLAQSAPVTLSVPGPSLGSGLDVRLGGVKPVYPYGEYTQFTVLGADLPAGARYEWFYFYPRSTDPVHVTDLGDPSGLDSKSVFLVQAGILPIGVRIVGADGTVLGTSPRYDITLGDAPRLQIEGIRSFYHPGDAIELTATVTPADSPFTRYRWSIYDRNGVRTVIDGASTGRVTLPASMDLHQATISVVLVEPTRGEQTLAHDDEQLIVLDPAAADLVYFTPLARHYHSGDSVNLRLVSSSASSDDTYRWFVKRADQSEFVRIADASTSTHRLVAEVALAGAQVMVELVNRDGAVLATTSPVHIAVDDHGSPPTRRLDLAADAATYPAGATARVTATASPASVLDRYEWWAEPHTGGDPVLLGVTRGNTFDVPLDAATEVFARLTKETGETYIESESVALRVAPALPAAGDTSAGTPSAPGSGPVADAAAPAASQTSAVPARALASTGAHVEPALLSALLLLAGGLAMTARARRRAPRNPITHP
jgi:surface-anchored protein